MNRRIRHVVLWLTGLVISVAVAAYFAHYYLEAVRRSIARRPLGDMRTIATALEAYRATHGTYPIIPQRQSVKALMPFLVPRFILTLPETDGYARPFLVVTSADHYELCSFGSDGKEGPNLQDGPTDTSDADILMVDGVFRRFPRSAASSPPLQPE